MDQSHDNKFEMNHSYKAFLCSTFFSACGSGDLAEVKKLAHQVLQDDYIITNGVLIACKNGHLNVVRYLFSTPDLKKDINTYVPYEVGSQFIPSGLLLNAYYGQHTDVIDFLLYDVNYDVCRDTTNFLNFHQHNDLLQRIEKRDLFLKLNASQIGLPINNLNNKKNKI